MENPDRHDEQLNDAATGAAHHSHEEGLEATRPIATDNEPEPDGEAGQPEKRGLLDNFRRAYRQARDGRKPSANTQKQDRNAKGKDRAGGPANQIVFHPVALLPFVARSVWRAHLVAVGSETRTDACKRRKTSTMKKVHFEVNNDFCASICLRRQSMRR